MDARFWQVRKEKHIWQMAFVVLAIVVFVQAFLYYKDNRAVRRKVSGLLSRRSTRSMTLDNFLRNDTIHSNPIEMQKVSQVANGGR